MSNFVRVSPIAAQHDGAGMWFTFWSSKEVACLGKFIFCMPALILDACIELADCGRVII